MRTARCLVLVGTLCFTIALQGAEISSGVRVLFVVDTSLSMIRHREALREIVPGLIRSGAGGQVREGDAVGFWTFNFRVADRFGPAVWRSADAEALAHRASELLRTQRFERQTRLDRLMAAVKDQIQKADALTVFLFNDGDTPLSGTPFDEEINRIYQAHRSEVRRIRRPFVTSLVCEQGMFMRWSVGIANNAPEPMIAGQSQPPPPLKSEPPASAFEPEFSRAPVGLVGPVGSVGSGGSVGPGGVTLPVSSSQLNTTPADLSTTPADLSSAEAVTELSTMIDRSPPAAPAQNEPVRLQPPLLEAAPIRPETAFPGDEQPADAPNLTSIETAAKPSADTDAKPTGTEPEIESVRPDRSDGESEPIFRPSLAPVESGASSEPSPDINQREDPRGATLASASVPARQSAFSWIWYAVAGLLLVAAAISLSVWAVRAARPRQLSFISRSLSEDPQRHQPSPSGSGHSAAAPGAKVSTWKN